MKRNVTVLLFGMLSLGAARAQENVVDHLTVPLSDPGKPCKLYASLMNGGIHVTGYEGSDIEIDAVTQMKKVSRSGKNGRDVEGMIHIPAISSALEVEEKDNVVEIDVESHRHTVDLNIRVPWNCSVELSALNHGDIIVENLTGTHEVENHNGDIVMTGISGSVVANTHNGKINVVFRKVDTDRIMAFGSFNRDVDVTFPPDLKASVKLKTEQGEIFSDFPIQASENPARIHQEKSREKNGRYKVSIERAYLGTINGGGQELQFTTYNGDILIRKAR